jgi:hypothetical protein
MGEGRYICTVQLEQLVLRARLSLIRKLTPGKTGHYRLLTGKPTPGSEGIHWTVKEPTTSTPLPGVSGIMNVNRLRCNALRWWAREVSNL